MEQEQAKLMKKKTSGSYFRKNFKVIFYRKDVRKNFLMEYEHLSAMVPGPGQYYPRKLYPHVNPRGVVEKSRKYGYFTKGPGRIKPKPKKRPLPKD